MKRGVIALCALAAVLAAGIVSGGAVTAQPADGFARVSRTKPPDPPRPKPGDDRPKRRSIFVEQRHI